MTSYSQSRMNYASSTSIFDPADNTTHRSDDLSNSTEPSLADRVRLELLSNPMSMSSPDAACVILEELATLEVMDRKNAPPELDHALAPEHDFSSHSHSPKLSPLCMGSSG